METKGVNIVRLTDAEKQPFRKATREVYEKWGRQIGPELVKKAEESIRKVSKVPKVAENAFSVKRQ